MYFYSYLISCILIVHPDYYVKIYVHKPCIEVRSFELFFFRFYISIFTALILSILVCFFLLFFDFPFQPLCMMDGTCDCCEHDLCYIFWIRNFNNKFRIRNSMEINPLLTFQFTKPTYWNKLKSIYVCNAFIYTQTPNNIWKLNILKILETDIGFAFEIESTITLSINWFFIKNIKGNSKFQLILILMLVYIVYVI